MNPWFGSSQSRSTPVNPFELAAARASGFWVVEAYAQFWQAVAKAQFDLLHAMMAGATRSLPSVPPRHDPPPGA